MVSKVEVKTKVEKKEWKKPELENVTGKLMAQPFIRFT